jgi:hypothetical protein
MTDETQARRSYWFWIGVLLPPAVLLYTLSLGPVVYLAERSGTGRETANTVYAPLLWLGENTPVGSPLDWYVDKWERLADPPEPAATPMPVTTTTRPSPPTPTPAPPP